MSLALVLPAHRSRAARLSMAALGIGLVVLIGITWGTGLLYVIARAGFPSPLRLALVDSVHIYVGLAAAVFFGLKVWRVGFSRRVVGVPNLTLWQRWVSWSLVILYPAIFLTGFAAILPLGAAWKESLVQAHLLTSVWSLVPTTLHLIHHRARATGHLKAGRLRGRLWAGVAVAALPAVLWLPFPRAVSPAAETAAGGAWVPSGLQGIYLDQVAVSADGAYLIAAGDGIYVSDAQGRTWHHLDLGGPAPGAHSTEPIAPSPAASSAAAPSVHAGHAVPPGDISTITAARGPVAIYAGSSAGLYSAADGASLFTQDHFPGGEVRAIAINPSNPFERWVATSSGVWFTWVFGHGWTNESAGLADLNGASALAFYQNNLYASDLAGVYRWDVASASWKKFLDEIGVISLTSNRDLLVANSYSGGIAVYDGRSWRQVGSGLSGHAHALEQSSHVLAISAPPAGGLIAVESGRVGFSTDGGRSWSELGRGLPNGTWAATRFRDRVYVATSDGLYFYALETAAQDTTLWWVVMIAVALGAAIVGIYVAARPGSTLRRTAYRPKPSLSDAS